MTLAQTREAIAYEMVDSAIESLRSAAGWFEKAHRHGRARMAAATADSLGELFPDRPRAKEAPIDTHDNG